MGAWTGLVVALDIHLQSLDRFLYYTALQCQSQAFNHHQLFNTWRHIGHALEVVGSCLPCIPWLSRNEFLFVLNILDRSLRTFFAQTPHNPCIGTWFFQMVIGLLERLWDLRLERDLFHLNSYWLIYVIFDVRCVFEFPFNCGTFLACLGRSCICHQRLASMTPV